MINYKKSSSEKPLSNTLKPLYEETSYSISKSLSKENFTNILAEAKENNKECILILLKKYTPLILKLSNSYKLKTYDVDDLIQIGNTAVLTAIKKYDLSKDNNYIDAYFINTIKNSYRNLARNYIKYQSESSLNVPLDEDIELMDTLKSNVNIEDDLQKKFTHDKLVLAIEKLSPDEKKLLKSVYFTPGGSLLNYSKVNNIKYSRCRTKLASILSTLKSQII